MEQGYTIAQASVKLGVREDSLRAMLPDVAIDMTGRPTAMLTPSEMDRLARLMQNIHTLHHEGPSGGLEE